MTKGKRALMCVFHPDRLKTTPEMQDWFSGSYPRFLEMEAVEFKVWWVDPEKGEWGAFYVFESESALKAYVASDIWQKAVPEKYGCTPTWRAVEPGPILAKKIVTDVDTE